MTDLTFTSSAVLGLLTRRPFTAYEIEQQCKRSYNFLMPRARSVLYNEPKKLVKRGLAKARPEKRGQRTVSVYEITDKGREAFREWLTAPAPLVQLEAEAVVRTLFGDQLDPRELATLLRQFGRDTDDVRQRLEQQAHSYVGGGPFPQQLPYIVLSGEFLLRYHDLLVEWADWAASAVEGWPKGSTGRSRWATGEVDRWVAEADRRARARARKEGATARHR